MAAWAGAVFLLLAIAHMPYSYYRALRLVVSAIGVLLAVTQYQRGATVNATLAAIVVVAFNPITPLHFERSTWAILNMAAAAVFAWLGLRATKPEQ